MFKGLGNLAGMLKQAHQLSGRMQTLNDELKGQRIEGKAADGQLVVEVNGLGEVIACRIAPELAGDLSRLERLLPEAMNQALLNSRMLQAEAMRPLMQMPGLESMLGEVGGEGLGFPTPGGAG